MKTWIKKFWWLVLLANLFACQGPAFASQNSTVLPTTSPYPGLTMLNNINSAFDTFRSNFSGASAPSGATAFQYWADSTNSLLKFSPDGTNYFPIGYFNGGWTAVSSGFKQLSITSTGSANAYVVTYNPAPAALVTGQKYSFITNFSNTGSSTVNFNTLGAKTLKKLGGVNLASGDLGSGVVVDCIYDGTSCQITSELSQSATGTVTSVSTTAPITGGSFTTSGTIACPTCYASTNVQKFSSSGTYTPTAGIVDAEIECVGPGGGGGGVHTSSSSQVVNGGGGGGGGYARVTVTAAAIGASKVVTVGTGGAGGIGVNTGSDGSGATSVGTLCVATAGGGGGGNGGGLAGGGGGGIGTTGDVLVAGSQGTNGFFSTDSTSFFTGGSGGGSFFSGSVNTTTYSAGNTNPGVGAGSYGGGGSGAWAQANTGSATGGAGANGFVIITEHIN